MEVIIIDDEVMAIELLSMQLSKYEDVEVLGGFTNPEEALEHIELLDPDFVFLDIEMGDINGLDFAQQLLSKKDSLEIVFVTAYSEYAVDAFELNALDYLLKPITRKRLDKTIGRLRQALSREEEEPSTQKEFHIKSFESFEVYDEKGVLVKWRTQKVKELFSYLWLQDGNPVNKNLIIEDIFTDKVPDKASTLLNTTIYQLRKSLRAMNFSNPIVYSNEAYILNISINSDYSEFVELINKKEKKDRDILAILDIYRGDLLSYEAYHWALAKQKKLQDDFYSFLMLYSQQRSSEGKYDLILKRCLDKWHEIDPFNNRVVILIMTYFNKIGSNSQLQSFYESYLEAHSDEFGFEPSLRIKEIYEKLVGSQIDKG